MKTSVDSEWANEAAMVWEDKHTAYDKYSRLYMYRCYKKRGTEKRGEMLRKVYENRGALNTARTMTMIMSTNSFMSFFNVDEPMIGHIDKIYLIRKSKKKLRLVFTQWIRKEYLDVD